MSEEREITGLRDKAPCPALTHAADLRPVFPIGNGSPTIGPHDYSCGNAPDSSHLAAISDHPRGRPWPPSCST